MPVDLSAQGTLPLVPPVDFDLEIGTPGGLFGAARSTPGETRVYPDGTDEEYARRRSHDGVDLKKPAGEWVYAAADGEVVEVSGPNDSPNGRYITIDHQPTGLAFITIYHHLAYDDGVVDPMPIPGSEVKAGQAIGQIAGLGKNWTPHVHFVLRYVVSPNGRIAENTNSIPIDPTRMLYDWDRRHNQEAVTADPVFLDEVGVIRRHGVNYFQVLADGEYSVIPLYEPTPGELELCHVLRRAFQHSTQVRLGLRTSTLFDKGRRVIEDVRLV